MVFQERSLVGALSVAENVFAGRQPTSRFGVIRRGQMFERAREILADLEVDIDPSTQVGNLSPGQQQMVEIAKGLSHELKLLILDEPTSSLTINEGRHLFRVLRRLAERGVAIVYVSHRLAEVFEIASRVTVLKDGRVTGVRDTSAVTHDDLIALMVGRELSFDPDPRRAAPDADVALEVIDLVAEPVLGVSFSVRYGEIVTLAGLVGAGRTETCEAIFGARPIQSGRVAVDGRTFVPRSPLVSMAAGISMLPEDRKDGGLFMDFPIAANIAAANLPAYTHGGLLADSEVARVAEEYVKDLRIATPNVKREVRNLSGGNQQKVLLAKGLAREPRILIVDAPTRGVDVGSKPTSTHPARPCCVRHRPSGGVLGSPRGSRDLPSNRRHVGGPGRRRADRCRGGRALDPEPGRTQVRARTARCSMSSDVDAAGAAAPEVKHRPRGSAAEVLPSACSCAWP
jgi:ribose transport system ATP-binding protein